MAFVFKSDRFQEQLSKPQVNVGPGTYVTHSEYKVKPNFVPFNSKADRNNEKKKKPKFETDIGPGSYNVIKEPVKETVFLSSQDNVKVINVQESSVFKSKTKRMDDKQINTVAPGPGVYEKDYDLKLFDMQKERDFKEAQKMKQTNNKNVIVQIMKVNKYQSIPSIPGQEQVFGYNETQDNELELNKNPLQVHAGIGPDSIGPGQYDLKDFVADNSQKGTQWHKSTSKRLQSQKNEFNIGPGQYDLNARIRPLYKFKPSASFASKSLRSFEQRKGAIINKHIMQKVQSQAQFLQKIDTQDQSLQQQSLQQQGVEGIGGQNGMMDNLQEEFEYIDDQTPGVGYYYNEKLYSSIKVQSKPEKLQFFGSSSQRFKNMFVPTTQIGPQDYQKNVGTILRNKKNFSLASQMKIPFNSNNIRFNEAKALAIPGPGSYNPKINLEDTLIKKIQQGYKGQFGTSEKRFVQREDLEELPGPGTYVDQRTNSMSNQPTYFLKGNQKQHFFVEPKNKKAAARSSFIEKKTAPPVGTYNLDQYDISKKVQKEEEIDPDLKVEIQNLGFLSSQPRFAEKIPSKNEQIDEEKDDSQVIHQKSLGELFRKNKKQPEGVGFGARDKRFQEEQKKVGVAYPSPGQYFDSNQNMWNKRTYNIEFTSVK